MARPLRLTVLMHRHLVAIATASSLAFTACAPTSGSGRVAQPDTAPAPTAPVVAATPGLETGKVIDRVVPSVVHLYGVLPSRPESLVPRVSMAPRLKVLRAGLLGTGFMAADGIVVTSGHVVLHAADIRVRFADGSEEPARVVALDQPHDLALLEIAGTSPPALQLAATVEPGERVLAIGNAFGNGCSVTSGVVTSGANGGASDAMVQTDASVHMQNTGGPLVNERGQVVAVNNAKATEDHDLRGIGYATPALRIRELLDRHHNLRGKPEPDAPPPTALRGISVVDLDDDTRQRMAGPQLRYGVVVDEVEDDSPAHRTGLAPDDVILAVNFEPVADASAFARATRATGPTLMLVLRVDAMVYLLLTP